MALIYNPTAASYHAPKGKQLKISALAGKTIGFIDNAKPNFGVLAGDLGELLKAKYGVKQVITRRKRSASVPANPEVIDELASVCDVVITGSGD